MIKTAPDLFGRCLVANEHKALDLKVDPSGSLVIGRLDLPLPAEASNEQLEQLMPVYVDLLSDKKAESKDTHFEQMFRVLDKADSEPDAAVMVMYTLEFPELVRSARLDKSGLSGCADSIRNADFPLRLLHKKIATNKRIIGWCRQAISKDVSHKYNEFLLASCVRLLCSASNLSDKSRQFVLQQKSFNVGLAVLYEDLASMVSRSFLPADAVIISIEILPNIIRKERGDHSVMPVLAKFFGTPENQALQEALERKRRQVGESFYQKLRMVLTDDLSISELLQASAPLPFCEQTSKTVDVCASPTCSKGGAKSCSRCKLVKYCGRECQVSDWRRHKKVCRKSASATTSEQTAKKKVDRAANKERKKKSPALAWQDTQLRSNPQVDYILVLDQGKDDLGLAITDPVGRMAFRVTRENAGEGDYFSVFLMYEFLQEITQPHERVLLRRQLEREYGVDPLSPQAKNAPRGNISKEELATALGGMSI